MIRQLFTLTDALDYKTLEALFNLYVNRIKAEEKLIAELGAQGKSIDDMTVVAHRKAYYDMKMIQLVNKFKKLRQMVREDYLNDNAR